MSFCLVARMVFGGSFVGRWWRFLWGGEEVCFSVFARLGSGRRSPAWVSDGRVRLWPFLWGGSVAVLVGAGGW